MNRIQVKIVGLFSRKLDDEQTINQIKKRLKRSYHLTYDNTTDLIRQGILNKKTRGHSTVCSINLKNEKARVLLSLNSIEEKEEFYSTKPRLQPLFRELTNTLTGRGEICSILIFGSFADGTETRSSDIDLLIITEHEDKEDTIQREIRGLETQYGREINQMTITRDMLKEMLRSKAELNVGKEALSNHIILHGAETFWRLVFEVKND